METNAFWQGGDVVRLLLTHTNNDSYNLCYNIIVTGLSTICGSSYLT